MSINWQHPPTWTNKTQIADNGTWTYPWPKLFLAYILQFDKIYLLEPEKKNGMRWGRDTAHFDIVGDQNPEPHGYHSGQITLICPVETPTEPQPSKQARLLITSKICDLCFPDPCQGDYKHLPAKPKCPKCKGTGIVN